MASSPRHILHAYPPARGAISEIDGRVWLECGEDGQQALRRIANVYPYISLNSLLLNEAADIIAPRSNFYITLECGSTLRELQSYTTGVYVWVKAGQLNHGGHLPISEYAIQFHIVSSERYRPIALAKVVLEFMKTWTNEEEGIHLELMKLCYKFGEAGVMRVMLISGALESAYEEAEWMASAGVSGYESHGYYLPVTFWPSGTTCRVTDGLMHAERKIRELYERPILQGSVPLQDITNQSEDNDENPKKK